VIVFRDIETRSILDLRVVGAWKYTSHPSTEIMVVAFAIDDAPPRLWHPGEPIPSEIVAAAQNPDSIFVAHNAAFEMAVEELILNPRFGWPIVPIERQVCTLVRALAAALPASLEGAAAALNLPHRKDLEGQKLMRAMSRPRRPIKGEDPSSVYWLEGPEYSERLDRYATGDIDTTRDLYRRLPSLIDEERRLWKLDYKINRVGFYADQPLARAALEIVRQEQIAINAEIAALTNGEIKTAGQVARIKAFALARGHELKGVTKRSVAAVLARGNPSAETRRLLELRRDGGSASVKKLNSLFAGVDADGRVRGTLRFSATSTGRWAGARFQPQNLPRPTIKNIDSAVAAVMSGDLNCVREFGAPLSVVGSILRSMICAAPGSPGHILVAGDFSAIESRVLSWLADEHWKLQNYREFDRTGEPSIEPYSVIASRILKRRVTPDDELDRQAGKIGDLSLGFGGGRRAWRAFDDSDTYSDAEVDHFQREWRASHPATVRFWRQLEARLKRVIRCGESPPIGRLGFKYETGNLIIVLPSGRRLYYPEARLVPGKFPNTVDIAFKDNARGGWNEIRAWYGVFVENVTSGVARDVLAAAMLRVDQAGLRITLHIHDELVIEVPEGAEDLDEFKRLMTIAPSWAEGLPIAVKVRSGHRYSKSTPKPPPEKESEAPIAPELVDAAVTIEPEWADDF
jgi:DNA polymerase